MSPALARRPRGPSIDATFQALAEPTRRAVVDRLRVRPQRAGELAAAFSMSPTAMSRHLKVLRTHRLVEEERSPEDARARVYRLRPEPFRALQLWLDEVQGFWDAQLDAFAAHVEASEE